MVELPPKNIKRNANSISLVSSNNNNVATCPKNRNNITIKNSDLRFITLSFKLILKDNKKAVLYF